MEARHIMTNEGVSDLGGPPPPRRASREERGGEATVGVYARGFGRCPFGGALLLMEKAAARSDFPGEAGQRTRRPVEWGGSPPMGEYICDASCVCAENRGAKEPATVVGIGVR